MAKFANQKTVIINRTLPKSNYVVLDKELIAQVTNALTPSAFKLWIYFCGYLNYELDVSPSHIEKAVGIKLSSYKTAMTELEEKGYLIKMGNSSRYTFVEKGINRGEKSNE